MLDNLLKEIKTFKDYSRFDKSVVMIDNFDFENEYIKVFRVDASNKWEGVPHYSRMDKQWGIIVDIKKDFTHLLNYQNLFSQIDMKVTKVSRGVNSGKYGIRIYHMAQNPDNKIIEQMLKYIFA